MSRRLHADVVVAGGGPAGLAAALATARAGLDVTVCERRRPPCDKACGEGLMPAAVAALGRLGVETATLEARPFRGIRYVDRDLVADGDFPEQPGLGLRRTALHQALARHAAASGARLLWEVGVTGLTPEGVATSAGALRARWVVAADGLHSPLRRQAGLQAAPGRQRRFGVRRHYGVRPWSQRVEVHWGDGVEAYVTPLSDDEIGVALLWNGAGGGFDALLARVPALAARLHGAPVTSRDRGAGPLQQPVRRVIAGHLALVGDASGYLDPITGEGLALAFQQALALGRALRQGDLRSYAAAHRRVGARPWRITRFMLTLQRRPRLRRRCMALLAAEPRLLSRLIGVLAGGPQRFRLRPRELARLARSLARPLPGAP